MITDVCRCVTALQLDTNRKPGGCFQQALVLYQTKTSPSLRWWGRSCNMATSGLNPGNVLMQENNQDLTLTPQNISRSRSRSGCNISCLSLTVTLCNKMTDFLSYKFLKIFSCYYTFLPLIRKNLFFSLHMYHFSKKKSHSLSLFGSNLLLHGKFYLIAIGPNT